MRGIERSTARDMARSGLLLALALLAGGCSSGPDRAGGGAGRAAAARDGPLTFRVAASHLLLRDSTPAADTVAITLPGRLYDPPLRVREVTRGKADRSTPESAQASFYSANRAGDRAWILANWARPDEIRELVDEHLDQNTRAYARMSGERILGRAEYEGRVLLLVERTFEGGRTSAVVNAYQDGPGGWKATNALSDDRTHDVVFAALRSGVISAAAGG